MPVLSRADTSLLGRWWWTVDRWMLLALGILMFCGAILVLAATVFHGRNEVQFERPDNN